jgi:hypothetical protein
MTTVERLDAKVVAGTRKDRPLKPTMELCWRLLCVADCNRNCNCNWSAHSGWFGEKPRPTHAPGRSQCPDQVFWSRTIRAFLPAWTSSEVTSNPFWNERVLNNRQHLASSIEPYDQFWKSTYISVGLNICRNEALDLLDCNARHSTLFCLVELGLGLGCIDAIISPCRITKAYD